MNQIIDKSNTKLYKQKKHTRKYQQIDLTRSK